MSDLIERATEAIDLFDAICDIHDPTVSAHDRRVRAMAKVLEAALAEKDARIAELRDLVDRLRLEAQIHAGEARGANATIHEAYQAVTEGKGEPGNWNGAVPIKEELARLRAQLTASRAECEGLRAAVAFASRQSGILDFDVNGAEIINVLLPPKGTLRPENEIPLYAHPVQPGWRNMESAPKDKALWLAWNPDDWTYGEGRLIDDQWVACGTFYDASRSPPYRYGETKVVPVLWTDLPAAPKGE